MTITFRFEENPAVITRLNAVVQNDHAARHPDVFLEHDFNRLLPWFTAQLANDNVQALGVYDGEQPIGYALLMLRRVNAENPFQQEGYQNLLIDQMSILPNYQNQGIGKQLLEKIFAHAKEQGIRRVQLSVWSDNSQAIHLYEKMGFETYMQRLEIKL